MFERPRETNLTVSLGTVSAYYLLAPDLFINKGIVWCSEDGMNFNTNSKISDTSDTFDPISANNFQHCAETWLQ